MNPFNKKTVFITGGSSGIGLELGRQLVKKGANIVLIARNPEKLALAKTVLEDLKIRPDQLISTVSLDVANPFAVDEEIQKAVNQFGGPDILIASAGINKHVNNFEKINHAMFNEVLNTNINGVRNVIFTLFEGMRSRKGHVVILSSAAALFGMYGYTAYAASKAALMGFAESLRYELAPLGMSVTIVFPPEVDTPMNLDEIKTLPPEGRAMKDMAGFLKPDKVAHDILKAIKKRQYFVVPGITTKALYFLHRLTNGTISRIVSDFIVRRVIKNKTTKQKKGNP